MNDMRLVLKIFFILVLILLIIPIFILSCKCFDSDFRENIYKISNFKSMKETISSFLELFKSFILDYKSLILFFIFIVIMIAIPFAIQVNFLDIGTVLKGYIKIGTPSEWFGFWSSYVGSILPIAFAYLNTKMQLKMSSYKADIIQLISFKYDTKKYASKISNYKVSILNLMYNYSSKKDQLTAKFKEYLQDYNEYNEKISYVTITTNRSTYKKINPILTNFFKNNDQFNRLIDSINKNGFNPVSNYPDLAKEYLDNIYQELEYNIPIKINKLMEKLQDKAS